MSKETGPVYGVALIETMPFGGMLQQMPSRFDLSQCRLNHERVAASYEVLLHHYQQGEIRNQSLVAELRAQRKNVHEVVKEFRKLEAMEGNEPIRCSRIHFGDWADRLLEPTAGRELLDEMRRKDEQLAEQAPLVAIAMELREAMQGRRISIGEGMVIVNFGDRDRKSVV